MSVERVYEVKSSRFSTRSSCWGHQLHCCLAWFEVWHSPLARAECTFKPVINKSSSNLARKVGLRATKAWPGAPEARYWEAEDKQEEAGAVEEELELSGALAGGASKIDSAAADFLGP